MASIGFSKRKGWNNYHLTVRNDVDEYGVFDASELGPCDIPSPLAGPERFQRTKGPLHDYIAKALAQDTPAGMLGTAWSFADLVGYHDVELDLTGLKGCSIAAQADLDAACTIDPSEIAFVSGGTTLRCLTEWAAKLRPARSIATSGTHLGPTIAGGFGTASHGSRLGFGGLQDMILGLHLIVSETESVWIESARSPVLDPSVAARFASSFIRDDDMFDDVLIHLGGMGIVNGVALRLVPYQLYDVLAEVRPLWPEWPELVEQGRYREIADRLGHDAEPCFYECTIDPFDGAGERNAIHLMYFPAGDAAAPPDAEDIGPLPRATDAIAGMVGTVLAGAAAKFETAEIAAPPFSAFAYYKQIFSSLYKPFRLPIIAASPKLGWEKLHQDVITGNLPGALYNASYAVERQSLGDALKLIIEAADGLMPSFIYTVRFVTKQAGTLAFTRFRENAVIEIDGVSDHAPPQVRRWGVQTKAGAMAIRAAFDNANLDYSMHWAKLGQLDAPKIAADYNTPPLATSPAARWRAARTKLLKTPELQAIFTNKALQFYGLI